MKSRRIFFIKIIKVQSKLKRMERNLVVRKQNIWTIGIFGARIDWRLRESTLNTVPQN